MDIIENNNFAVVNKWHVRRVKREAIITRGTFPDVKTSLGCETAHMTEDTPFVAIILYKTSGRLLCMGSIVDSKHILSAKKCYDKSDENDLYVMVGYSKAYWGRWAQVLRVDKVIRHENFLVLLRLRKAIKYTDFVKPIKLPTPATKSKLNYKDAFKPPYKVIGFSVDLFEPVGGAIQKDKVYKVTDERSVPIEQCARNDTSSAFNEYKVFCFSGNSSFCWGGVGGPVLKWMTDNIFLQIGVVVDDYCNTADVGPTLAARTDSFGDWIRGNSFHGHQPS